MIRKLTHEEKTLSPRYGYMFLLDGIHRMLTNREFRELENDIMEIKSKPRKIPTDVGKVKDIACQSAGIDNIEDNQSNESVIARYLVVYYLNLHRRYSLASAGSEVMIKHATVMHGIKKVRTYCETKDSKYYPIIKNFADKMGFNLPEC